MGGRRVFITVAEVSGDRHAAQLVRSLRDLDPTLIIEGLGGPEMAAAGATIHRETVGNAAMGLRGALRAVEVYRLLRWTRRHFDAHRPAVLVGVDSPSMNFHFARLAHARGIPVMQYVAPQLWAWREGRMEKVRRWVDRLACILPFEEAYFRGHGVNATFVGHPLFDELPPHRAPHPGPRFPSRPPVIGLLPGSRRSEAFGNFPGQLAAARIIRHSFPNATFLVPTTPATHPVVQAELARQRDFVPQPDPSRLPTSNFQLPTSDALPTSNFQLPTTTQLPFPLMVRQDAFDEMVPRCDLCLTVSGTATLHLAGFGVPMIVVYRAGRATWNLLGRWLIKATTYALVNVLAVGPRAGPEQHVVPELIPWFGDPARLAALALDHLHHPEKLEAQRDALTQLVRSLDHPGASTNVARMVLEMARARTWADGSRDSQAPGYE